MVLVEDGDLIIRVHDTSDRWENRDFLVDSNTVNRLSEPCGVLVARESANSEFDIVVIRDNTRYLGIIFSIMHCRFEDEPSVFDELELYDFLQVTEEYEVTRLLRPWAATWVKPYRDDSFPLEFRDNTPAMKALGKRFWTVRTLGEKNISRKLVQYVVKEIPFNHEHSLYVGGCGEVALLEDPKIPGLLSKLR